MASVFSASRLSPRAGPAGRCRSSGPARGLPRGKRAWTPEEPSGRTPATKGVGVLARSLVGLQITAAYRTTIIPGKAALRAIISPLNPRLGRYVEPPREGPNRVLEPNPCIGGRLTGSRLGTNIIRESVAVLALLTANPANRLAAAALVELFSQRRSLERCAEALVRWSWA